MVFEQFPKTILSFSLFYSRFLNIEVKTFSDYWTSFIGLVHRQSLSIS